MHKPVRKQKQARELFRNYRCNALVAIEIASTNEIGMQIRKHVLGKHTIAHTSTYPSELRVLYADTVKFMCSERRRGSPNMRLSATLGRDNLEKLLLKLLPLSSSSLLLLSWLLLSVIVVVLLLERDSCDEIESLWCKDCLCLISRGRGIISL